MVPRTVKSVGLGRRADAMQNRRNGRNRGIRSSWWVDSYGSCTRLLSAARRGRIPTPYNIIMVDLRMKLDILVQPFWYARETLGRPLRTSKDRCLICPPLGFARASGNETSSIDCSLFPAHHGLGASPIECRGIAWSLSNWWSNDWSTATVKNQSPDEKADGRRQRNSHAEKTATGFHGDCEKTKAAGRSREATWPISSAQSFNHI